MILVIESGSLRLYAFTQVIQLAFYVSKFPGLYFVADSFVQIMAIAPTSVVLVVALGRTLIEEAQATGTVVSEMQFVSGPEKSNGTFPSDTGETELATLASGLKKIGNTVNSFGTGCSQSSLPA